MDKKTGEWYRVIMPESFYDDMVGKMVNETPNTFTLNFSQSIGTAIFYKDQVKFESVF